MPDRDYKDIPNDKIKEFFLFAREFDKATKVVCTWDEKAQAWEIVVTTPD